MREVMRACAPSSALEVSVIALVADSVERNEDELLLAHMLQPRLRLPRNSLQSIRQRKRRGEELLRRIERDIHYRSAHHSNCIRMQIVDRLHAEVLRQANLNSILVLPSPLNAC